MDKYNEPDFLWGKHKLGHLVLSVSHLNPCPVLIELNKILKKIASKSTIKGIIKVYEWVTLC